jgi:hypothetical protein
MSVKFIFPPNKLAKLLRTPGGLVVGDAVEQASTNVLSLREDCLADLHAVLAELEQAFERAPQTRDEAAIADLYAIASRSIGNATACGMQSIDTGLFSLCNLLDHFANHGAWDRMAVAVHVRTFRLLLNGVDAPPEQIEALLSGLRQVADRYGRADDQAQTA